MRKEAKERQAKAGPKEGKGKKSGAGNLPEALNDTRDVIGAAVGMSGKSYERDPRGADRSMARAKWHSGAGAASLPVVASSSMHFYFGEKHFR